MLWFKCITTSSSQDNVAASALLENLQTLGESIEILPHYS